MINCIKKEAVLMKKNRDVQIVLSSANLDYQYSFQEIASEIEKNEMINHD